MSPGIARCATCRRVLPIRVTEELMAVLEMANQRPVVLLTVKCPNRNCRTITRVRPEDVTRDDRAA